MTRLAQWPAMNALRTAGPLCAAIILVVLGAVAARAETTSVSSAQVENRSATPIQDLYIRKSGTSDWGKSTIDSSIAAGAVRHVTLQEGGGCKYDLRVVFQDGRSDERHDVDLCQSLWAIEPQPETETAQQPKR